MTDLWHYWKDNWRDNYGVDYIKWKGTVGIGDSMYGLNIAYMRSFVNQKPTTIDIHYFFPKDDIYHYEDPEPLIERVEYLRSRFLWKDIVNVNYIFNSEDTRLYQHKYYNVKRHRFSELYRYWSFDPTLNTTPKYGKIVLWRPTNNLRQQLSGYKMPLLESQWQKLIDILGYFGYDVVEIDYRTPISEVVYHIRTCECCISYEGMWHYVSKNFFKPHIVFSSSNITKWHTPAAIRIDDEKLDFDKEIHKLDYWIDHATERAESYKFLFNKFVNGY